MSSSDQQLGFRMAKGAAWMVFLQWSMRGLGLISTIILARLLLPSDFGLAALALTLLAGLEVLGGFGFDLAIIRDQKADRSAYDSAWTLEILRGVVMAAVTVLGASIAAAFFADARLEPIMYVLALGILIDGFKNIGIVDFRKELLFDREFRFLLFSRLGQFLVTVVIALLWRNYWALVLGALTGNVLRLVLSFLMHSYRPRLSLAAWRSIMGFSKWLVVTNILNFLYLKSPVLFIGKLLDAQTLGLYRVAFDISNLPTTQIMNPVIVAVFPGFSRIAEEPEKLRSSYVNVLSALFFIAAPATVGIGLTAGQIVAVLLGPKWIEAVPLIQILAIYGFLNIARSNSETVLLALGRPRLVALIRGMSAALLVPVLYWSVRHGQAVGASWAMTGAAGAALITGFALVLPTLDLGLPRLIGALWRSAAATAAMAAFIVPMQAVSPQATGTAVAALLAGEIIGGAATYLGAHFALWYLSGRPDGPEGQLVAAARTRLRPAAIQ